MVKWGLHVKISQLAEIEKATKSSFKCVKEEMEEHLQSINENTAEIHNTSDHLAELDSRMEKMEQRMDEIHLMFREMLNRSKVSIKLNEDEQKIFLILYGEEKFHSTGQIADQFSFSQADVHECLLSMMDKGIPIDKELLNDEPYFKLDTEFKALQAKEKIITIDESISKQYKNALLKKYFP